jgi:hypothetical protein
MYAVDIMLTEQLKQPLEVTQQIHQFIQAFSISVSL